MKLLAAVVGGALVAAQALAGGVAVTIGVGGSYPTPVAYYPAPVVQVVANPTPYVVSAPVQVVASPAPVYVSAPSPVVVYTPVVVPAPVYYVPAPYCGYSPFVSFSWHNHGRYHGHYFHGRSHRRW
jgi:hypothetical protein